VVDLAVAIKKHTERIVKGYPGPLRRRDDRVHHDHVVPEEALHSSPICSVGAHVRTHPLPYVALVTLVLLGHVLRQFSLLEE